MRRGRSFEKLVGANFDELYFRNVTYFFLLGPMSALRGLMGGKGASTTFQGALTAPAVLLSHFFG